MNKSKIRNRRKKRAQASFDAARYRKIAIRDNERSLGRTMRAVGCANNPERLHNRHHQTVLATKRNRKGLIRRGDIRGVVQFGPTRLDVANLSIVETERHYIIGGAKKLNLSRYGFRRKLGYWGVPKTPQSQSFVRMFRVKIGA